MTSLIKNELIKIFKKKAIYITLLVVLAFVILTNCIYKFFLNNTGSYSYYSEGYIEYLKEEIAKLDPSKPEDIKMYIEVKTNLDIYELMQKYENDSWQIKVIQENVGTYINEKNTYLYGIEKDESKAQETQNTIDEIVKKLDNDDWKYFANLELTRANKNLEELQKSKENTVDKQELQEIEISIENAKIDKEVANYRIEKQIKYGNDYLNQALDQYEVYSKNLIGSKNYEDMEYNEKQEYQDSLKNKEINKYIIENNIDDNKVDLRGILKSFFSEYGLFIIVIIVMIAGTIVSEEFNKGTVKLLLIKPYSRTKILLSKYLTTLIMIFFTILASVLMELVVGGIIFGLDSLSVPVLEYNFNTNQLETINILAYLGLQILTQLPMLILLATLAFALSTIFTNSALAITISLLGYMSPNIINALVIQYKVEFMKYFVTMNWDLKQYMFGALPNMEGMTMPFSIIISLIYLFIMLIPTFIIFKKKNIKNI